MLKRVSSIQTGLTLGKSYEGALVELPYLRVANVQDGSFDLQNVTTIEVPPEIAARVSLRVGDVLMTEGGDLDKLGRGTVWAGEIKECLHQNHIFAVRCFQNYLFPKFLAYLTSSKLARDYFEATGKRTTNLASTNSTKVGEVPVPLPPLREQQRIAAYLDASCAAIDAAVAAKRRQLETLIALRSAIIRESVMGGIDPKHQRRDPAIPGYTNTPVHWRRGLLRYEIEIGSGNFASDKIVDDGEFAIYGGNGVMDRTDRFNVDGETVVIGRVGAYCGNAHYVHGKAWVSDNALIVKSRHAAQYLCYLFNALNFNVQANNTAQPVITGTKIKGTLVAMPPLTEQHAICVHLDRKLGVLKQLVASIETQIATLTAYRKSLIHECVTGQRRITEADVRAIQDKNLNRGQSGTLTHG